MVESECKWSWGTLCKRHAPVVIPNPNFNKDRDQRITLTEYPNSRCPCGDFEKNDER
jgi:hypothetical protein